MNDFSLTIHNPYYRNKKLPVALLHFTAGFLLLSAFLGSEDGHYPRWIAITFLVLGIIEIIYTFFASRLQRYSHRPGEIIRLVTALAFVLYAVMLFKDNQLLFGIFMSLIVVAFIMIFFIERRWNRPFILKINEEGVWFPRYFRYQLFPWEKFNHVILRGNILTLDFTTNRVAQLEVFSSFNENQTLLFNQFCEKRTQ